MANPFLQIPQPEFGTPAEAAILNRLRTDSDELLRAYREKNLRDGVLYIARDAAKRLFPEYLADPTRHNRESDRAASALADAVRRTILTQEVDPSRRRVVILTGVPASGKTVAASAARTQRLEVIYETILTNVLRADQIVSEALFAKRDVLLQLFYTSDPAIHVRRMIERARRMGRTVPLRFMAETFVTLPKIAADLREMHGSQLQLLLTDNSSRPEDARTHIDLSVALLNAGRYTEATCLEEMDEELDRIHRVDPIPEAIFAEARRR